MNSKGTVLVFAALLTLSGGMVAYAQTDEGDSAPLAPGEGPPAIGQPSSEDPDSLDGGGELFDELDVDDDGSLDEDELARFGVSEVGTSVPTGEPDRVYRLMERFDRDKDGEVDRDEFEQDAMIDREDPMRGARGGAAPY